jgi:hypothetical protein
MYQKFTNSLTSRQSGLIEKWRKLQLRLDRKLQDGSFYQLRRHKQRQLFQRLKRYTLQLQRWGFSIKRLAIGSVLTLWLALAAPTQAQTFVEQMGMDNPFAGVDVGYLSTPTLVDLDGDGDLDAVIGEAYGTIKYYENTQLSSTAAVLSEELVVLVYPNPSQGGLVQIDYAAAQNEEVVLRVADVSGRWISQVVRQVHEGGNTLELDVSNLPKGLYIVELGVGAEVIQRKLVID